MARRLSADNLVGVKEAAERAKVHPSTISKWRDRHSDFPKPITELASGPIWAWSEIADWLKQPRPPGRPSIGKRKGPGSSR